MLGLKVKYLERMRFEYFIRVFVLEFNDISKIRLNFLILKTNIFIKIVKDFLFFYDYKEYNLVFLKDVINLEVFLSYCLN